MSINLPTNGSTMWGSALNGYLKNLSAEVDSLKRQLSSFSSSIAFLGSGLEDGTYQVTAGEGTQSVANRNNTWLIKNNTTSADSDLGISFIAHFITKERSSFVFDPAKHNKLDFSVNNERKGYYTLHKIIADVNASGGINKGYKLEERTASDTFDALFTNDGYYPVYACREGSQIKFGVSITGDMIFDGNYIMIGLIKKAHNFNSSATVSASVNYYFIAKGDSASKTAYSTMSDNIVGQVSIGSGFIMQTDQAITIHIDTSMYYAGNGVNSLNMESVEKNEFNYRTPIDIATFNSKTFYNYVESSVESNTDTADTKTIILQKQDDNTITLTHGTGDSNKIYGLYLTNTGDIIREEGAIDNVDTFISSSYDWQVPQNQFLKSSAPVFLGCYYSKTVDSSVVWMFQYSTANGISPALWTMQDMKDNSFIVLPNNKYLTTGVNASEGTFTTNGKNQYNIDIISKTTDVDASIYIDANLPPAPQYFIPVFNSRFVSANLNSDGKQVTDYYVGPLKLENTQPSDKAINITEDVLYIPKGIKVGSSTASISDSISGVFNNSYFTGNVTFDKDSVIQFTSGTLYLSSIQGIVSAENAAQSPLALSGTTITLDTTTLQMPNSITISSSGTTWSDTGTITINAPTICLQKGGTTLIQTNTHKVSEEDVNNIAITSDISIDGKITFISDRREKQNIQSLDSKICYNAVKKLDAKKYQYIKSGKDSLGLIAQDIQEILPEYQNLLVVDDGIKKVDEGKLLFILWQAVRAMMGVDNE